MPQFQKIDERYCQYNKNVFPIDFLNDNNILWGAVLAGGTITAELQTDIYYNKKGLRIQCTEGAGANDAYFATVDENDYSFQVPRSGDYIFSFVVYNNSPNNQPTEIEGWLDVTEIDPYLSPIPLQGLTFKIGNNTEPEFSFSYRKFETFFIKMTLEEMKTYKFEWNINQVVSGFDTYDLTFDLFKLEYVGDKKQETPSFYTKPGE